MTPAASAAKKTRRSLERCYKLTCSESDYAAYRKACRTSVRSINAARASPFLSAVANASGNPKETWSTVDLLLHLTLPQLTFTPAESASLADSFTKHFIEKLALIKSIIATLIATLQIIDSILSHPAMPSNLLSVSPIVTHGEA